MRSSVIVAAVVAVLVGFGGTIALIVAAAQAVGADAAQTSSWVTALCLAMAGTSAFLSVRHHVPVITAWSTPGAALIAQSASGTGLEAAVGAFLVCGGLIVATAGIRPLGRLIERLPTAVAAAMLAGILVRFVIALFENAADQPELVLPLILLFLVVRLVSPAWAVVAVLVGGVALCYALGLTQGARLGALAPTLRFVTPSFDLAVLIGLGLPLYLVTMAGQNLPGFAVLRAAGYTVPSRSILAVTGIASVLTAPFGAHATNLAAITAAICTGADVHPDPAKRWWTGPFYAATWIAVALTGTAFVALLASLPQAFVATIAGVALIGPLAGALGSALGVERDRVAAVVTLAATASGVIVLGVGSAFWGLLAGLAVAGLEAWAWRGRAQP